MRILTQLSTDLNVDAAARSTRLANNTGRSRACPGAPIVAALLAFVFAALSAPAARAQGSRKDDIVFNPQGRPMAGATVRICTSAATGQPCTPLANVYSDPALTQALANPLTTDGLGNYSFYAAPGRYEIEISGPNITTKQLPNVILPNDPSSPTFTSLTTTSGISAFSLSLAGNLTVTGSTAVTGSLTVGGAPVPSTSQANKWTAGQAFKGPEPWHDLVAWGACPVFGSTTESFTGTISGGSAALAINAAGDWANGCGIVVLGAGPASTISAPAGCTVENEGASGSTTVKYQIAAFDATGGVSPASPACTSTTSQIYADPVTATDSSGVLTFTATNNHGFVAGQAVMVTGMNVAGYNNYWIIDLVPTSKTWTSHQTITHVAAASSLAAGSSGSVTGLSKDNYNYIHEFPVPANAWGICVYSDKGTGGTENLIAAYPYDSVAAGRMAYTDFGGANFFGTNGTVNGGDFPKMQKVCPATAPASNTNDWLATTVSSGAGTTSLTLANGATQSVSGAFVQHDDDAALLAATGSLSGSDATIFLPANGYFYIANPQLPTLLSATIELGGTFVENLYPLTLPNQGNYTLLGLGGDGSTTDLQVSPDVPACVDIQMGNGGGINGVSCFTYGNGFMFEPTSGLVHLNNFAASEEGDGSPITVDANIFFSSICNFVVSGRPQSNALPGIYFHNLGAPSGGGNFGMCSSPNSINRMNNQTIKKDCPSGGPGFGGGGEWSNILVESDYARGFFEIDGQHCTLGLGNMTWMNLDSADQENYVQALVYSTNPVPGNAGNSIVNDITVLGSDDGWAPNFYGAVLSDLPGLCLQDGLILHRHGTNIGLANGGGGGGFSGGPTQAVNCGYNQTSSDAGVEATRNGFVAEVPTGAEFKDGLDNAFEQLIPAPESITWGTPGAGSLAAGTYYGCVTVVDFAGVGDSRQANPGESACSLENTITLGASSSVTVTVNNVSDVVTAAHQFYRFYFSAAGNGQEGCYFQFATSPYTFTTTTGCTSATPPTSSYSMMSRLSFWNRPSFLLAGAGGLPLMKLGIGTTNPSTKLDVSGVITAETGVVVNGDAQFSASPRPTTTVFLPGALTSTWTGATWTPDKAVTITRVQVQAKTAPSGCSTNAIVRLTDGTTPVNVTVSAAAADSGVISQNYAAAAALTIAVQTAAGGCTTSPADANVIIQYRMQ
jgi:hypothetical protein